MTWLVKRKPLPKATFGKTMMFRSSPRSAKTYKKELQRTTRASAMPPATISPPLPRIRATLYGRVHLYLIRYVLRMLRKQSTSTQVWNQLGLLEPELNLHDQMKKIKEATRIIKKRQSRNHFKTNRIITQSSLWCPSSGTPSKRSVTVSSLSLKFLWKGNARMQSVINCSTNLWTTNQV